MQLRISVWLIVCLSLLGQHSAAVRDTTVTRSIIKHTAEESFYVAGYSVRTNNAIEMSGQGRIGKLWQDFIQQNLGAKIPGRVDQEIVVVYSDYASDEKDDYTYLLGARVGSVDHLPAGMIFRRVAAGPYAVFTTAQGSRGKVVSAEWKKIWSMQPSELGGRRVFWTDYEIYRGVGETRVEIDIGLRRPGD